MCCRVFGVSNRSKVFFSTKKKFYLKSMQLYGGFIVLRYFLHKEAYQKSSTFNGQYKIIKIIFFPWKFLAFQHIFPKKYNAWLGTYSLSLKRFFRLYILYIFFPMRKWVFRYSCIFQKFWQILFIRNRFFCLKTSLFKVNVPKKQRT